MKSEIIQTELWIIPYLLPSPIGEVASSISNEVTGFFNWLHPYSRTIVLGSTQPLTEVSIKNPPGGNGGRLENSRPSAGTLYKNVEPQHLLKFGLSRSVTGTVLHFTYAHQRPTFCPLSSHATSNVFQFQLHLVHSHTRNTGYISISQFLRMYMFSAAVYTRPT
jgi:hypothetical protein